MPTRASISEVVQFGIFELDLRRADLRKQGMKVKLQEQPLRVLQLLIDNRGQIVTREQLRTHIWPANTFVEFDHGLYSAMARLREALGDSSESPRFIETVARRGYRFIAPVTSPGTIASTSALSEATGAKRHSFLRKAVLSIFAGLLGGALFLGIVLGLNIANSRDWLRQRSNPQVHSLAVLPLANLSGDPAQEYFADGMTDELITELAELGSIRVISRTSIMQYKEVHKSLRQIGKELSVDAVLEGSVSRSGQHVRITAQLIDVATDQHLWARTYDRDLEDVLLLQSEMSRAIAGEVRAKIADGVRPRAAKLLRVDPEEQDMYLRARYHLSKGDEAEINKGIEYFRQAIARSPQDARNYAGLADSYLALSDYYLSPANTLAQAKQAALRALQLDEDLAETHVSLGAIRFLYDWDWQQADREFARAVELNPNSSDAHLWRGVFLVQMGRTNEAIPEIQRAEAIDPLSLAVHVNAGWVYYVARRDEQALEEWRKILDLDAHFPVTHTSIWIAYLSLADMGDVLSSSPAGSEADTLKMAALTGRYAVSGNREEAERLLSRLEGISKHQYVCPYEMATAHAVLGDKEKAFGWLSKGLRERSACMADLKVDPRLDSLRSDPRFDEFLEKVGFQKHR
jgi:TolB-like protein/DNA-binding winged helix-turn-helix (wHTH) protein